MTVATFDAISAPAVGYWIGSVCKGLRIEWLN
jgi:hypothetical protein